MNLPILKVTSKNIIVCILFYFYKDDLHPHVLSQSYKCKT